VADSAKAADSFGPEPQDSRPSGHHVVYAIDVGKRYMTTTRRTHLPSICNPTEEIKTNADGTGWCLPTLIY